MVNIIILLLLLNINSKQNPKRKQREKQNEKNINKLTFNDGASFYGGNIEKYKTLISQAYNQQYTNWVIISKIGPQNKTQKKNKRKIKKSKHLNTKCVYIKTISEIPKLYFKF